MLMDLFPVIIVTGPTASGKSQLALELAASLEAKFRSVIINADSQQFYKDIPILSAQPSQEDLKKISHDLYGFLEAKKSYSVSLWIEQVILKLKQCQKQGIVPFIVGGTGFYLKGLIEGFSSIPEVPIGIRQQATDLYHEKGPDIFYLEIQKIDPLAAARIHPHDKQRMIRVYEVFYATQHTLSYWQSQSKISHSSFCKFITLSLNPPRDLLYKAAENRFQRMIEQGAVEEVQGLIKKNVSKMSAIFKALGALEIASYIEGKQSLKEAIKKAQQITRYYIKRQQTWFRYQLPISCQINDFYSKETLRSFESVLKQFYS